MFHHFPIIFSTIVPSLTISHDSSSIPCLQAKEPGRREENSNSARETKILGLVLGTMKYPGIPARKTPDDDISVDGWMDGWMDRQTDRQTDR